MWQRWLQTFCTLSENFRTDVIITFFFHGGTSAVFREIYGCVCKSGSTAQNSGASQANWESWQVCTRRVAEQTGMLTGIGLLVQAIPAQSSLAVIMPSCISNPYKCRHHRRQKHWSTSKHIADVKSIGQPSSVLPDMVGGLVVHCGVGHNVEGHSWPLCEKKWLRYTLFK